MKSFRVSVWRDPVLNQLSERLISCPKVGGISRGTTREIVASLETGGTDVAVLPTPYVLQNKEAFDVIPEVAVSSISHPVYRLQLEEGFAKTDVRVSVSADQAVHGLLAAIVLKENYDFRLRKEDDPTVDEETLQKARFVRLGESIASDTKTESELVKNGYGTSPLTLDLGNEWYELVSYPMVWALFVMKKDKSSPESIERLVSIVSESDKNLSDSPVNKERVDYSEIRYRFDDSSLASLTELEEYLYYYGVSSDISHFDPIAGPDEVGKDFGFDQ